MAAGAPLIVGIGGTQRPGSTSELALRHALDAAERAGARVDMIAGPRLELPLYDPTTSHRPPAALRLVQALRRADGIIISSPSYHGGISGMIKNAIDYTEDMRGDQRPYFEGRAVGCIICAIGDQALGTGLINLRSVVHALRGWPTPYAATVKSNEQPFKEGKPSRPEIAAGLSLVGEQVVQFARMQRAATADAGHGEPRLVISA